MRQDLRRARLLLGRALIKSYREDWIPEKKKIDRIIEDMVSSTHWMEADPVQGGEKTPAGELLLQIKENNREYSALVRKIEKMAQIISTLTDEQRKIIDAYHWRGLPWYECAKILYKGQTTFFKAVYRVEEAVGALWYGEECEDCEE